MRKIFYLGFVCFYLFSNHSISVAQEDFQALKQKHETQLSYIGPSPQEWEKEIPPANVKEVTYVSNGMSLKAWYATPSPTIKEALIPAVVYIHGGFAFGSGDFADAIPFLKNGFALLTPTFRGENGNKGNFELMFGEVDDALAAVRWLGQQPDIDKKRIYVFGHSSGGGISALMSLYNEPLINLTGSSGGLYNERVFYNWKNYTPFDYNNSIERKLRVLQGNTKYMQKPHIGYIGKNDTLKANIDDISEETNQTNAPLKIITVEGDHYSSLSSAIDRFIKEIK